MSVKTFLDYDLSDPDQFHPQSKSIKFKTKEAKQACNVQEQIQEMLLKLDEEQKVIFNTIVRSSHFGLTFNNADQSLSGISSSRSVHKRF